MNALPEPFQSLANVLTAQAATDQARRTTEVVSVLVAGTTNPADVKRFARQIGEAQYPGIALGSVERVERLTGDTWEALVAVRTSRSFAEVKVG